MINLHAIKMGKIWTNDDRMPTKPSSKSVETNTTFRPFVSAKQPQKYEPMTIPEIYRVKIIGLSVTEFSKDAIYLPIEIDHEWRFPTHILIGSF